jgi:hypothetical protein
VTGDPTSQGFKGSFLFVSRRADLGTITAPLAEFYGGVRYGGILRGRYANPAFQSVKLRIYSSGLRISGRFRRMSLLVPLWEARFDELTEIWETGRLVPGIRFVTSGHSGVRAVTFWASRGCLAEVAGVLRSCGLEWTDEEGVATDLRYRPR